MAVFASDTFTDTAGVDLVTHDANWSYHSSYSGSSFVITDNNRIRPGANVTSGAYHGGTPAGADYELSADFYFVESNGGGANAGIMARVNTAANTMYYARYFSGNWSLWAQVAGTPTQIGSNYADAVSAGSTRAVVLRVQGTTISLDVGGTTRISGTNASIPAAGKVGLRCNPNATPLNGNGIHIDNFSADDALSGGGGGGVPIKAFRIIHG